MMSTVETRGTKQRFNKNSLGKSIWVSCSILVLTILRRKLYSRVQVTIAEIQQPVLVWKVWRLTQPVTSYPISQMRSAVFISCHTIIILVKFFSEVGGKIRFLYYQIPLCFRTQGSADLSLAHFPPAMTHEGQIDTRSPKVGINLENGFLACHRGQW